MASKRLATRYLEGDFVSTWSEARSYGDLDGDHREEVSELAEETMKRVARNADLLAERLRNVGWTALSGQLRTYPTTSDREIIRRIEEFMEGPLPPSLDAFWAVVGGIDFVWDYKSEVKRPDLGIDFRIDELDPLGVDAASQVSYMLEMWKEYQDEPDYDSEWALRLDLAPDHWHKGNYSGGNPYGCKLPFLGADPIFDDLRNQLPFVDYLRLSFDWAGFPGLKFQSKNARIIKFVEEYGRELEPF